MIQLWARIIQKHRTLRSETVEMTSEEVMESLQTLCTRMDVPRPIWLKKHTHEYEQFQRTAFTQDHFVEKIDFDRMEIERINPDQKKSPHRDPRNDV